MLQALQTIKADAEQLLAKFRAGIAHTEEEFVALVHKAEEAIGLHHAVTDESPASVDGIVVTEGAPLGESEAANTTETPAAS